MQRRIPQEVSASHLWNPEGFNVIANGKKSSAKIISLNTIGTGLIRLIWRIPKGFNIIAGSVLHAPGYDDSWYDVAYHRGLKNKRSIDITIHAKLIAIGFSFKVF